MTVGWTTRCERWSQLRALVRGVPADLTRAHVEQARAAGASNADVQLAVLIASAFSCTTGWWMVFGRGRRAASRRTRSEPGRSPSSATARRRPALPGASERSCGGGAGLALAVTRGRPGRCGWPRRQAQWLLGQLVVAVPHFVEEAAAAGHPHVYDGDFDFYGAAALRPSTATATAGPICTSPAASTRRPVRQPEPARRGAALRAASPTRSTGLLEWQAHIRSTSTATATSTSPCCATARTCCCAAWATAASSGPTRRGASTAATSGRPPSRRRGRAAPRGRRWQSATTSTNRAPPTLLRQPLYAAAARRCVWRTHALTPGWCPLSMLFSSWDRSGRADLRVSNDRQYYTDQSRGQEQLWRVHPASRRASTAPRMAGSRCASGAWASPATT